jgi:hypothetical protein
VEVINGDEADASRFFLSQRFVPQGFHGEPPRVHWSDPAIPEFPRGLFQPLEVTIG